MDDARSARGGHRTLPVHLRFQRKVMSERIGLVVRSVGRTGVLHQLTGVIAQHEGDIASVQILGNWPEEARTYFEFALPGDPEKLVEDLRALPIVREVEVVKTLQTV